MKHLEKKLNGNYIKMLCAVFVTVNESQMEIPAERGQDFVWRVEQRNKKAYLKFDTSKNRENVEY